jgi:ATP-dependent Clp protease ATP-binding subunit ClpC
MDRIRAAVRAQQGRHEPEPGGAAEASSRTPAASQVWADAEELAAGGAVGTQHLLEALARSEDTAAAKALASLGVEVDALAAALDEVGIEGTSDVVPEEAAARAMEIRVEDEEVHVVLRDPGSLSSARMITERIGGPLRGDDPVGAGAIVAWRALIRYLLDVQARVAPPDEPAAGDPASERRLTIVQRALRSRLGRRGVEPPMD